MEIALFIFDRMTALDAVGPLEVIGRVPDADVKVVGTTTALITHNAAIKDIASSVVYFADGRIARTERNERPVAPDQVTW